MSRTKWNRRGEPNPGLERMIENRRNLRAHEEYAARHTGKQAAPDSAKTTPTTATGATALPTNVQNWHSSETHNPGNTEWFQ